MTIINGANHHNVEDILANIRTSIAEESGPARLVAGDMHLPVRRDAHIAEEAAEFELPAIFKPGHQHGPDKPKLFGRLSDALKTAQPPEGQRLRTVIPFDPSAAGRMLEPPPMAQQPQNAARSQQSHQPAFQPQPVPQPQPVQPRADAGPVKREMPTFFDTRINRLGELTRKAFEPPVQPEPPAPPQAAAPPPPAALEPRQPPTLPEGNYASHAANSVDDAAAQLLRPMLRQWLQENMPKIVEKALLSEVQEDYPPKGRK